LWRKVKHIWIIQIVGFRHHMRYFFRISYVGTNWHGWQRQKDVKTIQGEIEKCLQKLLPEERISIHGCGRTDTGVHASKYFFHINLKEMIDQEIVGRINEALPPSIRFLQYYSVQEFANAQRSAISRTYVYKMRFGPFDSKNNLELRIWKKPDPNKIDEAITYLLEQTDFRCLCKTPDIHGSTKLRLKKLKIEFTHENEAQLEIEASHFLRQMVRITVALLLRYGQEKISFDEIKQAFETGIRIPHLPPSPGRGLYLVDIKYPDSIWA